MTGAALVSHWLQLESREEGVSPWMMLPSNKTSKGRTAMPSHKQLTHTWQKPTREVKAISWGSWLNLLSKSVLLMAEFPASLSHFGNIYRLDKHCLFFQGQDALTLWLFSYYPPFLLQSKESNPALDNKPYRTVWGEGAGAIFTFRANFCVSPINTQNLPT